MADEERPENEERQDRQREFSRRELLRAGMAVPVVLSLGGIAAACGGGSSTAAGHGDHTDSGSHSDHSDHTDAGHNDNSHGDSVHTDSSHTDHSGTGGTSGTTGTTAHSDGGGVKHVDQGVRPVFNHQDQVIRRHNPDGTVTVTHLDHTDGPVAKP